VVGARPQHAGSMTAYTARPLTPGALKELRTSDDAGRSMSPFTDEEGGAPLRCCLRRSEPGGGSPRLERS
jgi:hypothetical protein